MSTSRFPFGDGRYMPVVHSVRVAFGLAIQSARRLARLSRADLARGIGVHVSVIANLESGSIGFDRTEDAD